MLVALVACALLAPLVAPATVEEQRARLPPPTSCDDAIEGTWVALRYAAYVRTWNLATATIRRAGPGASALVAEIAVESWEGNAQQSTAPRCTPGRRHWVVNQHAEGTWDDLTRHLDLRATSWSLRRVRCARWGRYSLDHFTGTVDRALDEFHAVNNDHSSAINEPTLFRRVSCSGHAIIEGPSPPPLPPPSPSPSPPPRARRSCLPW